MVQYIFTPWRDRSELLMVRRQFYPKAASGGQGRTRTRQQQKQPQLSSSSSSHEFTFFTPDEKEASSSAVARVSMWMQRGNCPHLVESTALLVAAILDDQRQSSSSSLSSDFGGGSGYAVRAAYSAAFSRFVTGLLDGQQDKVRKMSMYDLAKSVGLPATFVELRHQATHEELPSLIRLRTAAGKALDWIWEYYWTKLATDDEEDEEGQMQGESRRNERQEWGPKRATTLAESGKSKRRKLKDTAVTEKGDDDDDDGTLQEVLSRSLAAGDVMLWDLEDEITKFGKGKVLDALGLIVDSAINPRVLRRAMTLSTELTLESGSGAKAGEEAGVQEETADDDLVDEKFKRREDREKNKGKQKEEVLPTSWSLYGEDEWVPKPIGVV